MTTANTQNTKNRNPISIVIHGGAGIIDKNKMTPAKEQQYHETLTQSLHAGNQILLQGGSSLDAVQAAIIILENSPLYNAGKGAVYTHDEKHELDAAIMDGQTLKAGSIASVTTIANPILLARAVMEQSSHVMLAGPGAEAFARHIHMPEVPNSYFNTEERLQSLRVIKQQNPTAFTLTDADTYVENHTSPNDDHKFGTVGAVALDQHGNLAAGTSSGGITNKRFGRIGDTPIIGAGTYANNQSCAISATGHGEYFIRATVAHDISALQQYKNLALNTAARIVIQEKLTALGGSGGIIAIDTHGNISIEFNTNGMFRGYINNQQQCWTGLYRTDSPNL